MKHNQHTAYRVGDPEPPPRSTPFAALADAVIEAGNVMERVEALGEKLLGGRGSTPKRESRADAGLFGSLQTTADDLVDRVKRAHGVLDAISMNLP